MGWGGEPPSNTRDSFTQVLGRVGASVLGEIGLGWVIWENVAKVDHQGNCNWKVNTSNEIRVSEHCYTFKSCLMKK